MKNRGISVVDAMRQLEADEGYRARSMAITGAGLENTVAYRSDGRGLLEDLRDAGFVVERVAELGESGEQDAVAPAGWREGTSPHRLELVLDREPPLHVGASTTVGATPARAATEMREIEVPLIVLETGDVLMFATEGDLTGYVEAVDVEDGAYVVFDAAGLRLALRTEGQNVELVRPEPAISDPGALKEALVDFASRLNGQFDDFPPSARDSLEDLVRALVPWCLR